ncbi:MAG: DUF3488 domain-containing transglutaminase family protein [Nitrospirae bacterium]|nr:DUF3488 domain-containing transglutaminase family protein [Nitrospirota bacterium]
MPATYKILTCIIALIGSSSLLLTEGMMPFFIFSTPFVLTGYYRAVKGRPPAHRFVIGGLSTVTLIVFFIDIRLSRDVISAVGHLTMLFHAIKSFDIKDPWDPLQVFFMSLIQLLLASEVTRSMVFGAIFLIFMAGMVVAMFYSHIIKEGATGIKRFLRPIVTMTLLLIFMTTVFFLVLPRFRGSLFGRSLSKGIKSGFSEKVSLGSLGEIKLDPTIVMRIRISPMKGFRPYWRGMTFDVYSDNAWSSLQQSMRDYSSRNGVFLLSGYDSEKGFRQEIILEPIETDLIFALRGAYRVEVESKTLSMTDTGDIYIPKKSGKRIRYTVLSTNTPFRETEPSPVYLQLPEDMAWLRGFTEGVLPPVKDNKEIAEAIETYLRDNYTYSLSPSPPPEGVNPIRYFLLDEKKGFCEHYATAMVLMLRSMGIPARVVSGYMGGEYNRYGRYYIVRQKDAHTWVEAFIDGEWMRFDPTPAAELTVNSPLFLYLDFLRMKWERYVVGYSRADQLRLFRFFERPVRVALWRAPSLKINSWYIYPLLFIIVLAGIILYILLVRTRQHIPEESKNYLKIRGLISKKYPIKESHTVREILFCFKTDDEVYSHLREFLLLYESLRFSGTADENMRNRYHHLYGILKKKL